MTVVPLTESLDHFSINDLSDSSALVLLARAGKDSAELISKGNDYKEIEAHLKALKASGKKDELVKIWLASAGKLILVAGVGSTADANTLRYAAGSVTRQFSSSAELVFDFPTANAEEYQAVVEGALLGSYRFERYNTKKSADSEAKSRVEKFSFVQGSLSATEAETAISQALVISEAVQLVKDLVNTPALDLYPENFAAEAKQLAELNSLDIEIFDESKLEAGGFGGILGVGKGSVRPPRLVKISYQANSNYPHLALVGKGITFDTGGLSLKPAASMVGMKYDMTGAATVLAVINAVAKLQLPVRVTSWLCIAENMPSGTALRPNDIIFARNGKSIEVLNTDAEGRLVLADGLSAASEENPDFILDVATLTGAATIALGNRYTGVLGEQDFVSQVLKVAEQKGEPFWQLPLAEDLRPVLDSPLADIANAKPGSPAGGTIVGALFLKEFVGNKTDSDQQIPWVHLDIAPSANNGGSSYGYTGVGPTGVAVRTLIELIANLKPNKN